MEIIDVEGIVISSIKHGESSKIINILTKDKGIIGVMAKGALKPKSKLRVVSELFTYAKFYMYYKEGRMGTLIEADQLNYFLNIRSDIEKYSYLNYLVNLAKDVYKESNDNNIYNILISALLKIEEGFNPKVITNIVEVKYLEYLGVGLYLDGCVICNNKYVSAISSSKGGFVCIKHRTNETICSEDAIKALRAYYYIDINKITELKLKDKVINELDKFITNYYSDYTGLYLKNKNFFNILK